MKYLITIAALFISLQSQAQFLQNFSIELGSELPMSMGIRAQGDLNEEFFLKASLGYLPSFYTGMLESMTMGNDTEINKVLSKSLSDSFAFELAAGYKFKGSMNPYVLVSYMNLSGGKERIFGNEMSDFLWARGIGNSIGSNWEFDASSGLNSIGFKGGIKYPAGDSLTLALELGIVKPISSSVTVDSLDENPPNLKVLEEEITNSWKDSVIFTVGFWAIIEL